MQELNSVRFPLFVVHVAVLSWWCVSLSAFFESQRTPVALKCIMQTAAAKKKKKITPEAVESVTEKGEGWESSWQSFGLTWAGWSWEQNVS